MDSTFLSCEGGEPAQKWNRNLCKQCHNFQDQDAPKFFEVFEHSKDLDSLKQSADAGCDFCQMLVQAYNELPNDAIREGNESLASSKSMRLQGSHPPLPTIGSEIRGGTASIHLGFGGKLVKLWLLDMAGSFLSSSPNSVTDDTRAH